MHRVRSKPLRAMSLDESSAIEWILMDIDDTFTAGGRIPSHAFEALWRLHDGGYRVVPVTGRPAGWCDHIARMWPVDGIVGENGAFFFRYDRDRHRMERSFSFEEKVRERARSGLERIKNRVLAEVEGSGISSDQPYRISDLAIDYCEDVERLPEEDIERIRAIVEEEGAVCKVSSIHVNCWYGHFDKVSCVRRYLEYRTALLFDDVRSRALFIGDSHNDEPLFREIPVSVGVANIHNFLHRIDHHPAYITEAESAAGFREMADFLLERKSHTP
jgi:HAD superfamily hydrolase (TIGR01484 family)